MLNSLFQWLDSNPGSYWFGGGLVTLVLATRVWSAVRQNPPAGTARSWRSNACDAFVLFLFVVGWRWPFLFAANDFNPDESELIAGAITLTRDPVFWRSVDGMTCGPLNFYVLVPLHWLGLPLDFFTARLAALLMISGALFACHRALARAFGGAPAWLGVLPAAGFFATVTHSDLVQYSTEHLTLALVAVTVWLLAERRPDERLRLWIACAVAGAAPWAKLQSGPISVMLIAWALWQVKNEPGNSRWHRAGSAVLAAAVPTLAATLLVVVTGQWETALRRYFLQNLHYVGAARPFGDALQEMARMAAHDGRMLWLVSIAATLLAGCGLSYIFRRARPPGLFIAGGLLTATALFAVLAPRREYLHYTLLLPVPLTIWVGAGIGGWWTALATARSRIILAAAVALAGGVPFIATRCLQARPAMIGQLLDHWRHPRVATSIVVNELAGPGDALAMWGWACHIYVETGLPQALRDPQTVWSITESTQREYHRAVYLDDFRQRQPAVFVDAVGPDAFGYDNREKSGHEIFPELADYVSRHYTLVADVGGSRIYGRNGLPGLQRLTSARLAELVSRGRVRNRLDGRTPPMLAALAGSQLKFVGDQEVLMLLPPAKCEWLLDADSREVTLEFGFDPVAYQRGSSNGAEISVEISDAVRTRQVFHRLLDPRKNPADRGRQRVTVPLPPFGPDSHLVVRTGPGEFNDNAWDWVYLAGLQFTHAPHFLAQQFPQFRRTPDFADAGGSVIYQYDGQSVLSLHAPSMVGYVLNGNERRLRFDYGFGEGAYTNGGNTDGAVFRVERERAGEPATVLFERFLQPQQLSGDRGVQHADVSLANLAPGDRLLLRIDPGPANNGAWDWTYLDHVELTGP